MKKRKSKPSGARVGDGQKKAEPPGQKGEAQPRSMFQSIRENLEAIAVAVVLALIIRHFSVEAFEIPTGSMAPTLFGIHIWVTCPTCDSRFNIGLQSDQSTGKISVPSDKHLYYNGACPRCKLPHHRAYHDPEEDRANAPVQIGDVFVCPHDKERWRGEKKDFKKGTVFTERTLGTIRCPICWFEFKEVVPATWWGKNGGHKILVDKFTYKIGEPSRWDVIVFQFNREINYIKRLIGKPGETVELKGGDVYINGVVERKHSRPDIQEVLWTKIHDLDIPERPYQKLAAWKEVFPPGKSGTAGSWTWNAVDRRWSVNTSPAGAGTFASLRYQRPIRNYCPYNLLYYQRGKFHPRYGIIEDEVGDKKVAFTVRTSQDVRGWIGAEIQDGRFAFQLRIPLGNSDPENPATLRPVPPNPDPNQFQRDRPPLPEEEGRPWPSAVVALKAEDVTRVEFENVDDRVCARIDGKEILALEYDSGGQIPPGPEENNVYLLAGKGADCNVESIQVFRDIHYTDPPNVNAVYAVKGNPIRLSADEGEKYYFACGDNSVASSDGRYWGPVPERNLMGKALLVFWPIWQGTQWQVKFIR